MNTEQSMSDTPITAPTEDTPAGETTDSTAERPEATYSITQLSREFDISARTIRFYEAQGLLNPDRSKYRRAYSKRDRVRLMLILRGKRVGFSLSETRELFDIYDSGAGGKVTQLQHWFKLLQEHEQRLEQHKRDIEELLKEIQSAKQHCQQSMKEHQPDDA